MSVNNEGIINQGNGTITAKNIAVGHGATINQTNNVTQKPLSLAEAAVEIQKLLEQLEKINPTATEPDQIAYVNIIKPDLKQRAIAALQQGGETAIDELVLENKYLKVIKAIVKGWLQPNI